MTTLSAQRTNIAQLRCVNCSRAYAYGEIEYTCHDCGVKGILDVEYDYDAIEAGGFTAERLRSRPDQSIWRYQELLPVDDPRKRPTLQLGMTPIYDAPRVAEQLGLGRLRIKDDGRLPTGSFKDRASAIAVARAQERGVTDIACASTGNAASSLAGMSANAGLNAHIFVPAIAPEAKVAQLLIFGADVLLVEGSYDQAYWLCMDACAEFGWMNRNCAINPFLIEGKKTCGLEVGEQVGTEVPEWLAVSVGDGCTVAGIWKGLKEMKRFGLIDRLPRLLGVQAEGAEPISEAFAAGGETVQPREARTLADSIAVGEPRNGVKALRAIRESEGTMISVSDDAILAAMGTLARGTGVFGEPAGVAAFAGIIAARESGQIAPGADVLHVVTGNGLKDAKAAFEASGEPRRIPVSIDAVRAALQANTAGESITMS